MCVYIYIYTPANFRSGALVGVQGSYSKIRMEIIISKSKKTGYKEVYYIEGLFLGKKSYFDLSSSWGPGLPTSSVSITVIITITTIIIIVTTKHTIILLVLLLLLLLLLLLFFIGHQY